MAMNRPHHFPTHIAGAAIRLLRGDAGAGMLLIVVALSALLAANSPFAHAYHALFHDPLR
jgi:NhaA family Na+:H+ antiporter